MAAVDDLRDALSLALSSYAKGVRVGAVSRVSDLANDH